MLVAVLVAVALGASTVLASSHPPDAGTATVAVQDFAFSPVRVTIAAGDTVVWSVRKDPEQHTVTPIEPGAFEPSGQLFDGDDYVVRFDTPGTFDYACALHPFMTASVVVRAAVASVASSAPAPSQGSAPSAVASGSASPAPTEPVVADAGQAPLILGVGLLLVVLVGAAIAWSRARRHPPA